MTYITRVSSQSLSLTPTTATHNSNKASTTTTTYLKANHHPDAHKENVTESELHRTKALSNHPCSLYPPHLRVCSCRGNATRKTRVLLKENQTSLFKNPPKNAHDLEKHSARTHTERILALPTRDTLRAEHTAHL